MLCAPLGGRAAARVGARAPILAGMAISCVAVLALLRLEAGTPFSGMWWPFALLGVGAGIALPPMTVTALGAAPAAKAGMASAIHNASRQLGQTLGVAALGTIILARAGDGASDGAWVDGLHAAVLAAAAALALATLAITRLVPSDGQRRAAYSSRSSRL
jgi:DHA2 family methylenomycin A resistance protein-like MFS transporter